MNKETLLSHMPDYYRKSQVIENLNTTYAKELTLFSQRLEDTLNQFFIDTADFTLERWEKDLGITVNNSKQDEYRRSVIKSKLRGTGTVTIELINNVAESYANGEVDVIEDNINYRFIIKFVGIDGVPPNLDDLKQSIEDIKPAHLQAVYEMKYITVDALQQMTVAELQQTKLLQFSPFQDT